MKDYSEQDIKSTASQLELPDAVQAKMEGAFGTDLSGVRLMESPSLSRFGVDAAAQGADVAFAPGKFDPGSQRGQTLIGHELSHVLQQARGEVARPQTKSGVVDSDSFEHRADLEGAKAARGEPVAPMSAGQMQGVTPMSAGMSGAEAPGIQLAGGKREHNRKLEQQKAALDAEDAQFARWDAEAAEHRDDILENGLPENAPQPEGESVPINLTELAAQATALGWTHTNGGAFDESMTENFFREISGRSAQGKTDEDGVKRGQLFTGFRSEQDMMDLFRNHDEATALRVIQPLMDLDANAFAEQFPFHKMTLEERRAAFPQVDAILQPMVGLKQWAEKYAFPILSEANQARLDRQINTFEAVSKWIYNERMPMETSFDQVYQMQVSQVDEIVKGRGKTAEMQQRLQAAEPGLAANGSVLSFDEFAGILGDKMPDRGSEEGKILQLSRSFPGLRYNADTRNVTCPFSVDDLRGLAAGDRGTLDRYASQLRGMSWRDSEGNERRAGQYDSNVDEFMGGFENDLQYFGGMRQAAGALRVFGGDRYLSGQKDVGDLRTRMALANGTYNMMTNRAENMDQPTNIRLMNQYGNMKNRTWIKRSLLGKKRWI